MKEEPETNKCPECGKAKLRLRNRELKQPPRTALGGQKFSAVYMATYQCEVCGAEFERKE